MGSVFRPTFTKPIPQDAELVEKNGERFARFRVNGRMRTVRVTTGDDDAPRLLVESTAYTAKYRDHNGRLVKRSTGCRDEANARRRLSEWESEVERVRAGVLSPADADMSQHTRTPLESHFTAFDTRQQARGTDPKYRENTLRALRTVAAECSFAILADVKPEPVERWLVARTEAGASARTRNLARESWLVFLNWCIETGRLATNPLTGLSKANVKADPRRQRRPLAEDELDRLLAVAVTRPTTAKLAINRGKRKGQAGAKLSDSTRAALERSGRERALLYKALVLTGLRKGELASISVGQVRLDGDPPHFTLAAADEKARRGALVPLRDDLACDLREWLALRLTEARDNARREGKPVPEALPAETPLFSVPLHLVRNLRKDLVAAGIPVRDGNGCVVDVHALRHTFGTMLARGGVASRVTQELMRHSDPRLTANVYTHLRMTDTRAALDALPALTATRPANPLVPLLVPTPVPRSHFGAIAGTMAPRNELQNGIDDRDVTPGNVNGNGPLTTLVISGPSQVDLSKGVAAVGFEPTTSRLLQAALCTTKPWIPFTLLILSVTMWLPSSRNL